MNKSIPQSSGLFMGTAAIIIAFFVVVGVHGVHASGNGAATSTRPMRPERNQPPQANIQVLRC
jgi:heme/copper-type cytochrome/quinol oxidase subunit 3